MSAPTVQCPNCLAHIPAVAKHGAVVCPSCEQAFALPAAPPPAPKAPLPVARAVPAAARPVAAPVPPRAEPPARTRRRDEEDETPRTRSRRRRDDDDDDKPKRNTAGVAPVLIVGGVLALVLVLGGVAVAAVVLLNPPAKQAQATTAPARATEVAKVPPRGNWNDPGDFLDPKPPEPKKPGGDFLDPNAPPPKPFEPPPPPAPKYAAVVPFDLKPTKLNGDTGELQLPGKVADTCGGGGGRFFILHLTDKRQLAVFDVCEAKVVKYLPLVSDKVKFAAGMNKLVVAYPDEKLLVRYDLTTFEKEATEKSPFDGPIHHLALGSASAGPLLVDDGKVRFVDPATFREIGPPPPNMPGGGEQMHFRAGPDGTLFGGWCSAVSPMGLHAVAVKGAVITPRYEHDSIGHLLPGTDGQLYTGNGLYSADLKAVGKSRQFVLPAAEGGLHLRVHNGDPNPPRFPGGWPGATHKLTVEVRLPGDDRAAHTFRDLGPLAEDAWMKHDFSNDKRVHFAPTAQLLVTIPNTNDKLVLHRFDLDAAYEASGVDYLYVTSRPPAATAGKAYEYQMAVKSKKGGVTFKLDLGPKGLAVSPAGKITWATPHDLATPERVVVTVSDESGQEVAHAFDLTPGGAAVATGPAPTDPVKPPPVTPVKPVPARTADLIATPDRVFELKPSEVTDKAVVALPAAADAVCGGGGGRFLICRLPTTKQLAVVDVVTGKLAKYLPLTAGDALFAAGMSKLYVLNPTTGVLQRYDLATFEREVSVQNPLGGTPSLMCMGHSTDGPLYIGGPAVGTNNRRYGFVNLQTMKELEIPLEWAPGHKSGGQPDSPTTHTGPGHWTLANMSGDGRTMIWSNSYGNTHRMTIGEKAAHVYQGARESEYYTLRAGPSGHLFGPDGVYDLELKRPSKHARGPFGAYAPATSGPWYVAYIERIHGNETPVKKLVIGHATNSAIQLPLTGIDGIPKAVDYHDELVGFARGKLNLGGRMHLVPEAEILAVLDEPKEKVHLHRVSVKDLLDKSDADYLMLVGSPRPAARGAKWAYTPQVWTSKLSKAVVKLESGPDGMTVAGGVVGWDVPNAFAGPNPTVILSVSDDTGRQEFQTFTLTVRDDPPKGDLKPVEPPKGK